MSTLTTLETKTAATAPRPSATGEFRAVFATFDVPDHDGDVTRPGAFRDGAEVIVGPWGHKDGGLPTGRGVIRTNNREAFVEGNFFLDTPHGLATYETVKSLGNLAEWSYQFRATQTSRGRHEGQPVLLLEGIRVFSVDPVLVGAGIDTRTDHIKTSPTGLLHREQARFDETLFRLEMARYAKTREDLIASAKRATRPRRDPGDVLKGVLADERGYWTDGAGQHHYREVPAYEVFTDTELDAEAATKFGAAALSSYLGREVTPARIRWFRGDDLLEALDHEWGASKHRHFIEEAELYGRHFERANDIWIRADLGAATAAHTVHHEMAHRAGADEPEARQWSAEMCSKSAPEGPCIFEEELRHVQVA